MEHFGIYSLDKGHAWETVMSENVNSRSDGLARKTKQHGHGWDDDGGVGLPSFRRLKNFELDSVRLA